MTVAKGAFTEKTRKLIMERAGYKCEICGLSMVIGQIHHRQPRGMGGTRSKSRSSCSNGLYVHAKCHAMVESQRERAYMMGWLVKTGYQPESTPVKLWDGWFVLTVDGQRLLDSPDD